MRIVFLACFLFVMVVYAGPGTHQYYYGEDKKHKEHHMKEMQQQTGDQKAPELSEENMVYYLFVIHDINGDGYLDGHELMAAFTDFDDHQEEEEDSMLTLQEVEAMVDHVLLEDDKNGDGVISWSEYLESQLYAVPS